MQKDKIVAAPSGSLVQDEQRGQRKRKLKREKEVSSARQSRVPATVLPRKSRLRGGLGTSLGGFGGLWAAFGWFLAPRGLLGVL